MKRSITTAAAMFCLVLVSCTSFQAFKKGDEYAKLKDWDRAVREFQKALDVDPDNIRYQMALQNAKLESSRVHFDKGQELQAAGHYELAAIEYQVVVQLDPTNQFAAVELKKSRDAMRRRETDSADITLEDMKRRATERSKPPTLNPASNQPISLSFPKETGVKDIYQALGNGFGINIMFDQRLKDDKITIELRDVTAQTAIERVMQAAGHFYKVLDEKTIIVIPDSAQTRREYEDLVIRTFYLSNGDAEQVTNVVRTMIEARNVFPLKALNAITIRDTADKVLIAEKIIEANDKAKAEVVVSVELLQVDANKIRDIGMTISGLGPIQATIVNDSGQAIASLTSDGISAITSENISFTVPSVAYSLIKSSTEAELLARPQMRISEGEKATLHIGQRVPVPVTTFSSANTGGSGTFAPATTYQYQDVGIKIGIEPRVHHNREVTLKLTVEVSNIAGNVTSPNGPSQPIIGTRTIESTIRLKDGETNFLAGLIQQNKTNSSTDTPFLSDIPLLGRLFSKESNTYQQTDLVLTMTPHIIRIPDITESDLTPMWVGTSNNLTFRGNSPRMESMNDGDPFTSTSSQMEAEQFRHETPRQPWQTEDPPPPDEVEEERTPMEEPPPGSGPTDPFKKDNDRQRRNSSSAAVDPESNPRQEITLTPRVSPQPSSIILSPGREMIWTVAGMDLEGLRVKELILRYDPYSIYVADVGIGRAIAFEIESPPVAIIDRELGIIRVTSSDEQPLRFASGGDLLFLRVQGTIEGESWLNIDPVVLFDSSGMSSRAVVTGGRATVE